MNTAELLLAVVKYWGGYWGAGRHCFPDLRR